MEVRPESRVNLELLGITRYPTVEDDGQPRRRSVERYEDPHHIQVYLSSARKWKMEKVSDHN